MHPKETLVFDGREVFLEWIESEVIPKGISISQVTGYCVDDGGRVLLVKNKRGWGFPGGHPESGETPEETLHREVGEEACVKIKQPVLIGYMEVKDPENESVEGKHYIQLRYKALVDVVQDFRKEFETSARTFVDTAALGEHVSWISSPTGQGQMETLSKYLLKK